MKKFLGIAGFLLLIYIVLMSAQLWRMYPLERMTVQRLEKEHAAALEEWRDSEPARRPAEPPAAPESLNQRIRTRLISNNLNLIERIGLSGIVCLGVSLLIISGGIDLSIGAVVCFSATLTAMLISKKDYGWNPTLAMLTVLMTGVLIGLINGILVTKVKVQAFVVTLCGLFIYRGAARWLSNSNVKSLDPEHMGLREGLYLNAFLGLPKSLFYLLILAGIIAVFLHLSIYGRYLYAIGSNERAARYSGIKTDRYKILAYVICSALAALYGILDVMKHNSAQPTTTGNFLELYAIAGAVLGGCSLRGGEGNVLGVLIGTAILILLPTLITMFGIPSDVEFIVIGLALLFGAILDEALRRFGAKTR